MNNEMDELLLEKQGFKYAISSSSVEEENMVEVAIGKETIVIARINGIVHATEGICTHAYAELVDGELDEHCLYCPLHFASFDIRDGSVLEGPAEVPLPIYEAVETDGQIWVKIE
ncbi:Rieske 2Fe-2S domain-containing protein [Staphylococcus xylosus]|uniref:Rieske (2Fe-2S) protein n=1 Tax=Staphylococcus xylosus TaxID=1288 RepID=UPI00203BEF44|nr:Rieske 2Fe-2S domain-containing protein [Staphylococcus xylosus]MCM3519824.1 Rieske 2Fe-2S domain-containing protein [Staphylococcus xylosus]